MDRSIRITRDNIHQLASEVGVSASELFDEMVDAKLEFKREQDKRWSYEFFGKDEAWYDKTMQKVKEIRDALPEDINHIEATIKQYGWITKNGKKRLSMPFMQSDEYPEYAHAVAVEYALTKPDSYRRMMNWD
jgi:hypothetical protein